MWAVKKEVPLICPAAWWCGVVNDEVGGYQHNRWGSKHQLFGRVVLRYLPLPARTSLSGLTRNRRCPGRERTVTNRVERLTGIGVRPYHAEPSARVPQTNTGHPLYTSQRSESVGTPPSVSLRHESHERHSASPARFRSVVQPARA